MSGAEPWILGISSSHNGGVCVLHGDRIVVAIQEERLLRFKRADHPAAYPSLALRYCLSSAGIRAEQLDAVVVCGVASSQSTPEDIYLNPEIRAAHRRLRVLNVPHHLGHAVAAYALSGARSSGILVVDGGGSPWEELPGEEKAVVVPGQLEAFVAPGALRRTTARETISLYTAEDGVLTPVEKHIKSYPQDFTWAPHEPEFQSLGDMYAFFGQQIFGSFFEGPGKLMALAAYGKPVMPPEFFFRITDRGFEFQKIGGRGPTARFLSDSARFNSCDQWPAHAEEYQNLAASVQRALEEALLHLCRRLRALGSDQLAYAGGVALNSVANERIVREGDFGRVFIMPAAEDSGPAIGAAYYGLWQLRGYRRIEEETRDHPGRTYPSDEVNAAIDKTPGLRRIASSDVVDETATLIAEGKIVGWFQEGSELGPRALGQRSILCDSRKPDMKDILNQQVKFREGFRPFAPMILAEDIHEWFDVPPEHAESPFMLRVLPFRKDRAATVPGVVHVDGTGRVQTVSKQSFPLLHRLLTRFKEKTGVPILLNTSFNIAGEPIVESPADALWCLLFTGLDYCVLGDQLVEKDRSRDWVLDTPLALTSDSILLRAFERQPAAAAEELVFSVHASRTADFEAHAKHKRFGLRITVSTRWGDVLHALPGGFAEILGLVDDRHTGHEIYEVLSASGGQCSKYTIEKLRRQLGLLRRIGAIRATAGQR